MKTFMQFNFLNEKVFQSSQSLDYKAKFTKISKMKVKESGSYHSGYNNNPP